MMGTAWLCDGKGKIVEVIRDDLNLCLGVTRGTPFTSVVDTRSADRAEALIAELLTSEAVFDWHMDVLFADKVTPLHFAGGVTDDHLLIMASVNRQDMAALERQLLSAPKPAQEPASDARSEASVDEPAVRGELQPELTSLRAEVSRLERELAARESELEALRRRNAELEAGAATSEG